MIRNTAILRRVTFATFLMSVIAFAMMVLVVPTTEAAPAGNCTYYNNASHTNVVGQFGKDCCNNPVAWGKRTSFYTCGGCFICFPPPPR